MDPNLILSGIATLLGAVSAVLIALGKIGFFRPSAPSKKWLEKVGDLLNEAERRRMEEQVEGMLGPVKSELDELTSDARNQRLLEPLQVQLDELQKRIRDEEMLAPVNDSIDSVQRRLDGLENEMATETDVRNLLRPIRRAAADNDERSEALGHRIDAMENGHRSATERLEELGNWQSVRETQLDRLESAQSGYEARLRDMEEAQHAHRTSLRRLSSRARNTNHRLDALDDGHSDAEARLGRLETSQAVVKRLRRSWENWRDVVDEERQAALQDEQQKVGDRLRRLDETARDHAQRIAALETSR